MRDAVKEKSRKVHDIEDAEEIKVSTEWFDIVSSNIFNLHSIQ